MTGLFVIVIETIGEEMEVEDEVDLEVVVLVVIEMVDLVMEMSEVIVMVVDLVVVTHLKIVNQVKDYENHVGI